MDQLTIFDCLMEEYKIKKPIRLIELFAGVGSQAMALRDIGADFEHYKVIEFDKYAIKSYNAIHGTNFSTMDITKISADDLNIVSTDTYEYIMTYSFPCTDLSVAGKMKGMSKGSGTRSGLLWEVERLLNETKELPQVLLMENVPQVISNDNIKDFHAWQDFLISKGYSNYVQILNAKDYGIPQNRERCFMVSILGEYNYRFPQPFKLEKRLKDLKDNDEKEEYKKSCSKWIITNEGLKLISKGWAKINGEISQCLTARGYASYNYQYFKDENGTRRINSLESFRIMGFNDSDHKKIKNIIPEKEIHKQAGNSIVKQVLMEIFKQLF